MSGGVDKFDVSGIKDLSGKVDEVMEKFKVDEKTAGEIIEWATWLAMEKMEKWVRNTRKRQRERADEVYQLVKKLKKGDQSTIDEIEKRILEMVIER